MKRLVFLILFFVFSLYSFSQKENKLKLYTYTFGLEKLNNSEQVLLADSLNFEGFLLRGFWENYSTYVESFYNVQSLKNKHFRILGVFFPIQLEKTDSLLLEVLPVLAKYKISLWPIFWPIEGESKNTDKLIIEKLSDLCDLAKENGLDVVIYPHVGTLMPTAGKSIPYIQKVNKDNLFTSFHLCHEIAGGNKDDLYKDFSEMLPYIKGVTISGSDTIYCQDCPFWPQYIKPLDKGTFDVQKFIRFMNRSAYADPVILHTYEIAEVPKDHLSRSMKIWTAICNEK